MMKKYILPITDIVVLKLKSGCLDERDGNPQGSYYVDKLVPDNGNPEEIGGDDVNSFKMSLWEE